MNRTITEIQDVQESEYEFPYHYISQFRLDFNQTFNWTWGLYHASTIEFLLAKISRLEFNSIADIGCGDGRFTKELFTEFPGKKIVGIDYSAKAINIAKALNPSIRFLQTDILHDQIEESFDLICLIEVLEHIPDTSVIDFVEAIYQLLSPGGKLIITVPHINKPLEDKHFQHFTIDSIKEYTTGIFDIQNVVYFEKTSIFSKIINKILTNGLFILNQKKLKNLLYQSYKRWLFPAQEENCSRIYIEFVKLES